MKRITSVSLPVAAVLVGLSAGDVRAQSNPWSVSFDLGTQVALSGDVHGGGSGTELGLPTQIEARSYRDICGNSFYWAASLGYRVGEGGEIRVQDPSAPALASCGSARSRANSASPRATSWLPDYPAYTARTAAFFPWFPRAPR